MTAAQNIVRVTPEGAPRAIAPYTPEEVEPPPPLPSGPYELDMNDFPDGWAFQFTEANYRAMYTPTTHGYQTGWDAARQMVWMEMPSNSGANACGRFVKNNCIGHSSSGTVGVAMDVVVNSAFITGGGYPNNNNSPKFFITYTGSQSCQANEFTGTNGYFRMFPQWYTACGAGGISTPQDVQPGGETSCPYGTGNNDPRCLSWQDGIRVKFVMEIRGMGTPQNWLHIWHWAYGGDPRWADKWTKVIEYDLNSKGRPIAALNSIHLSLYATSKSSAYAHDPWRIWYQNALINPGPIADIYGVEA